MAPDTDIVGQVEETVAAALALIHEAPSADELEAARIRFLGRNGEITKHLRSLGQLPKEQRPSVGDAVNRAKQQVTQALADRTDQLQEVTAAKPKTCLDVTLPGIRREVGRRHPVMRTMDELKSILLGLGFGYEDYPELEDEYHNFDALNTPSWHPARDLHDTFYTRQDHVLRTHTSAFQVRAIRALKEPPIRAMTSGRCYRRDEVDATHFPIFHQLDVIAIDRGITFADLKWTLYRMLSLLLGSDISLRFRPSYFPFTTPSAEVDVFYDGRWMELLGSGMIRPEVLTNGGLDPQKWQGFAFGIGIDRLAMARHHIEDIRLLYENDRAFLLQF